MNKKFLSAILFGALMATSAGTFVSCKDYDDDIQNLQTQIDTNKTAIAELQKLVGAGKWVSSISSIENGFTVTMSDGSSVQIKGINGKNGADGKDGKNGAEWTIGEDGFWYVDGEKTENVAVGKNGENGKNGVSAPAPFIGADGNWVVYAWDEAKGEFVQEATEISAQGTNAYAVKANGVYTLFIADENGEMQEIALPATSDAFLVSALSTYMTYVEFESAKWNPTTSNKYYKELVKAFPEIANIEKKSIVKQGGYLPVLVNPANVELTNEFNFSLQTIKGEVLDIEVANPQKGLVGDYYLSYGNITSRAAKAEDCIWTLSVDPKFDEEEQEYVETEAGKPVALVVENAKGTVVKTAFAYNVEANDLSAADVKINGEAGQGKKSEKSITFAESIDLFAEDAKTEATPVVLDNEKTGYYIIELADALQVEEMGLSIAEDGHTLVIANMPARQLEKTITLNVIALGLNGSVAQNTVTLKVAQEIAASTDWANQDVTLKVNSAGTFTQSVLWDITEQEFSATQTNQLYNAVASIEVSYIDEEGEKQVVKTYAKGTGLLKKKANGTDNATGYANWAKLGFTLDAADYKEGEYNVLIKFMNATETTVIYSAAATMNVKNPELGATYVKLVPGFVDENGVYQITGTPKTLDASTIIASQPTGVVTYALENALILGKGATIKEIIDLDNANYVEEGREDEAFEMHNLVKEISLSATAKTWEMSVNKWAYKWETLRPTWRADIYNQLYKTRNIRAMISLFGNEDNVVPFDFQVEVKSEIYAEDVKTAITIDETKLVNEFGAVNVATTPADESVIDIKAAITKAVSVAGTDKDKTYSLFATGKGVTNGAQAAVYNYTSPKTAGKYVLGADGNIVELSLVEYLQMLDAFGNIKNVTITNGQITYNDPTIIYNDGQDHAKINSGDVKYKLTKQAWDVIWNQTATQYYNADGTAKYYDANGDGKITADDKADTNGDGTKGYLWAHNQKEDYDANEVSRMAIYAAFKAKISFNISSNAVAGTAGTALDKARDSRIASVSIKYNDPAIAKIYFQNVEDNGVVFTDATGTDYSAITIKPVAEAPNSVAGDQVKVAMTLTVRDAWGMIMNVPFEVTVKTKK